MNRFAESASEIGLIDQLICKESEKSSTPHFINKTVAQRKKLLFLLKLLPKLEHERIIP